MHCSEESDDPDHHSRIFKNCPSLKKVKDRKNHVPLCEMCGAPMKPHSMFFDESYSEHYYRKDSVDTIMKKSDILIVVGTALATNFAKRICVSFLADERPVIEINLDHAVKVGNTF
jgi:NAD-dependent deacetylase